MNSISFNQKLAVLAFTLALLAMLFSFVIPNGLYGVNEKPNYISVLDLATKIKNRERLYLVDLRPEEAYLEFHLPTARNIAVSEYVSHTVNSADSIVFYSGDDELTKQLWKRLPDSLKSKAKILYGGVHDWYERLLYPKLPVTFPAGDSAAMERIKTLNKFYGGQPEFTEDSTLLNYYHKDLSKVLWTGHRRNKQSLVRKGC